MMATFHQLYVDNQNLAIMTKHEFGCSKNLLKYYKIMKNMDKDVCIFGKCRWKMQISTDSWPRIMPDYVCLHTSCYTSQMCYSLLRNNSILKPRLTMSFELWAFQNIPHGTLFIRA